MTSAVAVSFRREATNLKAIINRGWYHCDYRLMDHEDVKKNPKTAASSSEPTTLPTLDPPTLTILEPPALPILESQNEPSDHLTLQPSNSPSDATERVAVLDQLNFNVTDGLAGNFMQDDML